MIVSTNRPYFAPYPGFFQKAFLVDLFIILDTVQFPQGTTWISRNRFKNDQGCLWMTVPIWKKGLGIQKISDVRICRDGHWAKKHLASLKQAYRHAPYFEDHRAFIEKIFSFTFEKLVDINMEIIRYLMDVVSLKTEVVLLSETGIEARGDQLLIEICRHFSASIFLSKQCAQKYLSTYLFDHTRIELRFFKPPALIYPQLWGEFIGNLSIFDLLFNCGPKSKELLLRSLTQ